MVETSLTSMPKGAFQYRRRFGDRPITVNEYAIDRLGFDQSKCVLKIDSYILSCVPLQIGFNRAVLMMPLSSQEAAFFKRYVKTTVGFSIILNPSRLPNPAPFFLRCTLSVIGPMKGRSNMGLIVLDFKNSPDEMVIALGDYLDFEERIKIQYEDYGKTPVKMTEEEAKRLGLNMKNATAVVNSESRRIQILTLNTKSMEYIEAPGSPVLAAGTAASYKLCFRRFDITASGIVNSAGPISNGIILTSVELGLCHELVEIFDGYWHNIGV